MYLQLYRGNERQSVRHPASEYRNEDQTQEGRDPQGTDPHRGRPHRGRPTHRGSDPHKGRDPHRRHTDNYCYRNKYLNMSPVDAACTTSISG